MTGAEPASSDNPTFAERISGSGALQLVGVIANFSGIVSSALGIYSFIDGLGQPSNSDIMQAINQLEADLQQDFTALGNLIAQQTQIIVDTVNRDAMAGALANSDVATARIQAFLSNNDTAALETAETASIAGVQFFIELGLTSPADLAFFLPGFVKAGTTRILVLASEPSRTREPNSVIIDTVASMISLLSNMIAAVTGTVQAAHTVSEKSHIVQCAVNPQVAGASLTAAAGQPHRNVTVIDGYYHEEDGAVLAFFDAQHGNPPCEQPSGFEEGALADAQQARSQGITDELAFIGIPKFQQILQSWQALLITPIKTVLNLAGTWASGGASGPVISRIGNALSVDMSAYRRPTASGNVVDAADITVTFPDDKTYTGKLQLPNRILWSNHSTWTKV
jgi:hypothetical protein